MAALTTTRNTPEAPGVLLTLAVAASTKIFAGALVALDANGRATEGAVATDIKGIGRAEETVDNSAGQAGDKTVTVKRGVFRFANSAAADEITAASIGDVCFIVDDQTVAKTDGTSTRSPAGVVMDVDAHGVWVRLDGAYFT